MNVTKLAKCLLDQQRENQYTVMNVLEDKPVEAQTELLEEILVIDHKPQDLVLQ